MMKKTYFLPEVEIFVLDKEICNDPTQDSTGELDGDNMLSNDALFDDDEESGKGSSKVPNVWDK